MTKTKESIRQICQELGFAFDGNKLVYVYGDISRDKRNMKQDQINLGNDMRKVIASIK